MWIELETPDEFDKPLSLADNLRAVGLTLSDAHRALNGLKAGSIVWIKAYMESDGAILGVMRELGVKVQRVERKAPPIKAADKVRILQKQVA